MMDLLFALKVRQVGQLEEVIGVFFGFVSRFYLIIPQKKKVSFDPLVSTGVHIDVHYYLLW